MAEQAADENMGLRANVEELTVCTTDALAFGESKEVELSACTERANQLTAELGRVSELLSELQTRADMLDSELTTHTILATTLSLECDVIAGSHEELRVRNLECDKTIDSVRACPPSIL